MLPEIKAQWVAALRSGDYQQGQGYLARDDKFCCLGVLCELAVKADVDGLNLGWAGPGIRAYNEATGELPEVVTKWAGLHSNNPMVNADEGTYLLSELNDGETIDGVETHTFAEIADLIDAQL